MAGLVVSAALGERLPVTILTGFLGAGKTTLLSALMREPALSRTAVIINEFGETALDHTLVRAVAGTAIIPLESGCVCCTLRDDLTDTLRDLFRQRVLMKIPEFERVIIETTGLADPAPIIHALHGDPVTAVRFRLDALVTVVDSVNGDAQMDIHPEAVKQAALADRLILSKTDLARPAALARLRSRLAILNPGTVPVAARFGLVPPGAIFAEPGVVSSRSHFVGNDHHDHLHDHGIQSFTLSLAGPLDGNRLVMALESLLSAYGDQILRIKGLVEIAGEARPMVIHGVGHQLYPWEILPRWPRANRDSALVFITQNLSREAMLPILRAHLG